MDQETKSQFRKLLTLALEEDLSQAGDITSRAVFPYDHRSEAELLCKDEGVLAGSECFAEVFHRLDPRIEVRFRKQEGDRLVPGDIPLTLSGPTCSLLEGERTALNFLSFLSGIATQARRFKDALPSGSSVIILDTRKTLPGYRALSKYAVRVGGAENHRFGLYDMVMLKENHITAAGGIRPAVEKIRALRGTQFPIEVECRSADEAEEACRLRVDRIMLDNMSPETIRAVLQRTEPLAPPPWEASGNMTLEKIRRYGSLKIQYISVGGITHSVSAFDFSFLISDSRPPGDGSKKERISNHETRK